MAGEGPSFPKPANIPEFDVSTPFGQVFKLLVQVFTLFYVVYRYTDLVVRYSG